MRHESHVFYAKARIELIGHLQRGLLGNLFVAHDAASEALLARPIAGLHASPFTERRIVSFARANGIL